MLKRLFALTIVVTLILMLFVVQISQPARADSIVWEKGWTWTESILESGPRSEVRGSVQGYVRQWGCDCDERYKDCSNPGNWECYLRMPPQWFTFSDGDRKQFSILGLHSSKNDPQIPEGWVFGLKVAVNAQLFYSGSPYAAIGIDGTTIVKYAKTSSEDGFSIESKDLRDISGGEYLGVPGTSESPTRRHGCANTLGDVANFNQLTDFSISGCTGYYYNSVAFDRSIPIFGTAHGFSNTLYAAIVDQPSVDISHAGYVLTEKDGETRVVLPESYGVTDENKQVWAEFGVFSRDSTISIASDATPASFVHNNRSFEFKIGSTTKIGSNVTMYVSDSVPEEPLVVRVPNLRLYNHGSTNITYRYAVGAASRRLGKYFVAHTGETTVPPSSAVTVMIPDITIPAEYIVPGEEITVRGVVVGDRGDTSRLDTYSLFLEKGHCGFYAKVQFDRYIEGFAQARTHREEYDLGFLPVVHTFYGNYTNMCTHGVYKMGATYVRYVGDVAQASVRFIPLSLSVSGSTEVRLGMNIQGAKQFWPNGSSFVVSTDVPLHPSLQFHPQLSVSYTITNASGVITGTATIEQYQVKGSAVLHFNDGVWFFGTRTGGGIGDAVITFSPSRSPYTVPLITHREGHTESCSAGITDEVCDCIAFNIPECYHVSENNMKIRGGIRVRARVSVPLPDGTVMKVWSPWSPTTNLYWKMFLQQERR